MDWRTHCTRAGSKKKKQRSKYLRLDIEESEWTRPDSSNYFECLALVRPSCRHRGSL